MKRKNALIICLSLMAVLIGILVAVLLLGIGGDHPSDRNPSGDDSDTDHPFSDSIHIHFSAVDYDAPLTAEQIELIRAFAVEHLSDLYIKDYTIETGSGGVSINIPNNDELDLPVAEKLVRLAKEDCASYDYYNLLFYYDEAEANLPTELPATDQLICTDSVLESITTTYAGAEPAIDLKFNAEGTALFADATKKQFELNGYTSYQHTISIWESYRISGEEPVTVCLSNPAVLAHITNGEVMLSGSFTSYSEAENLVRKIKMAQLPFEIDVSLIAWYKP